MPLVPKHTYLAWFKRTSWVYRAFAYLYQNPLWTKRVPVGFSLCPLFWSALFSIFLFRPLVYLVLGVRALAHILRVTKALRFTDMLACRLVGENSEGITLAIPTVIMAFIGVVTGSVLFMIGEGVWLAIVEGELLTSTLLFPNVILFATCWAYASQHKEDPDRCKVEWYVRAALVLSIAALVIFHPAITIEVFIGYPVAIVIWLAGALWWLITAAVGGVWWCITYLIASIVAGSLYAIGAVLFIFLCGLFGWIAAWLYPLGLVATVPTDSPPLVTKANIRVNMARIVDYVFLLTPCELRFYRFNIRTCVYLMPAAMALAESKSGLTGDDIAPLLPSIVAFIDRREEERKAREAARSAMCKRFTSAVAFVFTPFTMAWKQVRIGASYAWALVKAIKGKQCPYLRFED